jgi:hypothetical protein
MSPSNFKNIATTSFIAFVSIGSLFLISNLMNRNGFLKNIAPLTERVLQLPFIVSTIIYFATLLIDPLVQDEAELGVRGCPLGRTEAELGVRGAPLGRSGAECPGLPLGPDRTEAKHTIATILISCTAGILILLSLWLHFTT